uniref:PX domain-containing protein n=2 Tax=Clastoptera arizonana TaxID=38151 RepID=A0A1B6EAX1_9HEMI
MAYSEDTAILKISAENKTLVDLSIDSFSDVLNYCTSADEFMVVSPLVHNNNFFYLHKENLGQDVKDLVSQVDNPQKHLDTFETYITYRVVTNSSRKEYSETRYEVHRRYSDFLWLRMKLINEYPTFIVPPLPEKHTLLAQLDRYSRDFILCRMVLLNSYINRIVNHPIISYHSSVHLFLTAKPMEFSFHRKKSTSIIEKVTGPLQQLATGYKSRNHEPEFKKIEEYVNVLTYKLSNLVRIGDRIYKERKDYCEELQQLKPVLLNWAKIESYLHSPLHCIATMIETCSTSLHINLIQQFHSNFSQPIKEYELYIDAVKEALNRRDALQLDYELSVEEMGKKKIERNNLTENSSIISSRFNLWKSATDRLSRENKLDRLNLTIPDLNKTVELKHDNLEIGNEELRADIGRWKFEEKNDLKHVLYNLAEQHIQYYKECLEAWEKVLPFP